MKNMENENGMVVVWKKKIQSINRINQFLLALLLVILFAGCASDSDDDDDEADSLALESPFLICASKNPGGVGFDFSSDRSGTAYNLDDIPDLEYDLKIKTIKGYRKVNGVSTKKGCPYAELYRNSTDNTDNAAEAVNITGLDSSIVGETGYTGITSADSYLASFAKDTADIDTNLVDASSEIITAGKHPGNSLRNGN